MVMFLDFGKKLEYLERTQAHKAGYMQIPSRYQDLIATCTTK